MIDVYPVWLLAYRELRDQLRDWRILAPLVILILFFPFLMLGGTALAAGYASQYGATLVAERVVPFFTLVVGFFPVTVSLVIALESFVGEKERGTIEPLLSTPLYDWQLYLGKLLAGLFLPLLAIAVDLVLYLLLLYWFDLKTPDWITMAFTIGLSVVQAVLMVSGAVVISTQSTSVRGANLLVSFIVIPIGLLLQGESIMLFWGNHLGLALTIAAVLVMTVLIIRLGLTRFKREYLLGREIDVLNLRWVWSAFKSSFLGNAKSLGEWYRLEVAKALRKQALALVSILGLGLLGTILSYFWIRAQPFNTTGQMQNVASLFQSAVDWPEQGLSMRFILWHNLRAVVFISAFGMLSFGVLGTIVYLLNMAIVGGTLGILSRLGYSPWLMTLAGILPHGIFELSALMLIGASVLYAGALLLTPQPERALGEILVEAWADWAKIFFGLALPLLLLAAAIEAGITPRLLLAALH